MPNCKAIALLFIVNAFIHVSNLSANTTPENFRFFNSQEEAMQWFTNYEKTVIAPGANSAPRPLAPQDSPEMKKAQLAMLTVWQGFQTVYPDLVAGLPTPFLVVIQDLTPNAYAVTEPGNKKLPFILAIHTSALSDSFTMDEITGLFAHELAHLVFRHGDPKIRKDLTRFFYVEESSVTLDFNIPNNLALENTVNEWMKLAKAVGPFSSSAFGELPSALGGDEDYFSLLAYVVSKFSKEGNEKCADLLSKYNSWRGLFASKIDLMELTLKLSENDENKLSSASQIFSQSFAKCLRGKNPNLVKLISEQYSLPESAILNLLKQPDNQEMLADVAAFEKTTDFPATFFEVVGRKKQRMREIEATKNFQSIRFYSREDAADDVAVNFLYATQRNPFAQADFLIKTLDSENQKSCRAILSNGKVPAFGSLKDEHHSICYRAFRLGKLVKHKISGTQAAH